MRGKVLNDTIDKASLNLVNITFKKGAITDSNGSFIIPVRLRDTINISAVQYEPRQFVVSEKIYSDQTVYFYLIPKITVLQNVDISNTNLSGNLLSDATQIKENAHLLPGDLGLQENTAPERTREERRLYTGSTRGADQVGRYNARFDIPLAAVINGITGKTKRLKKHIAVSNYQTKVWQYRDQFPDEFYIEECNIPQALIEDFVYYAIDDEELPSTDKVDKIKLFAFFMVKAKKYLDLRATEKQ
ncbi:hypothetical protein EAX61_14900 [Dokdonia sinensis]|uniref:Carboxypeptidase-like regulatory domain-containing protein n=1 Tax=Dokdonia sinensis TaxID=2479847 RepID=A0A3M0G5J1_9FLAO|nr:hypothetical protein [Dokdonia sinensis]RMB56369.1 hypothetical protein EAX61_14900 [Dokdonia sinensis]